jgi:signal recognition particle receptor subunit beta
MQTIAITGFVDNGKTTFAKLFVKEPSNLDKSSKEKKYNMTINVNLDYICTDLNKKYLVLDAPGHNILFYKLVISVILSDIVVLVVSCKSDDGGILSLKTYYKLYMALGLKEIIIVLSKIDLVNKETVYKIIEYIKELYVGLKYRILPFTFLGYEDIRSLFYAYLDEFKNEKDISYYILKSYNINKPNTSINKLVPAVIGFKSTESIEKIYYLGPVEFQNSYKVVPISTQSSIVEDTICTLVTNLSMFYGSNYNLAGVHISKTNFKLVKEFSFESSMNYTNCTLAIILDGFYSLIKLKSNRANIHVFQSTIPFPALVYKQIIIIRKGLQGWEFMQKLQKICIRVLI